MYKHVIRPSPPPPPKVKNPSYTPDYTHKLKFKYSNDI